jgi:hypothetical protein
MFTAVLQADIGARRDGAREDVPRVRNHHGLKRQRIVVGNGCVGEQVMEHLAKFLRIIGIK